MRMPITSHAHAAAAIASIALLVGVFLPLRAQQRVDKEGAGSIVSGANGLPDLARGKAAAAAGRVEDAEHDLVPLAERGYVDAQLAIGRLYAHQETAEANKNAIRWFRSALPQTPQAEVPLARALVRGGDAKELSEAEKLFDHAWTDREDVEALSGLVELYAAYPAYDHEHRAAALAATAEKLDQPQATAAVIRWYRSTQDEKGHGDRLLALCRKSLDLVAECYVDLVRDARTKGDKDALTKLTVAAMSQFGQDRVPFNVAAGIARALVSTPNDDDEPATAPVTVSDVPEVDAEELAPSAQHVGGISAPATALRSCAQEPIGVVATATQLVAAPAAAGAPAPSSAPSAPTAPSAPSALTAENAAKPASATASPAANAEPDLANQIIHKLSEGSAEARVEAAGVVVRYPYLAPDFDVEPALEAGRKQGVADATLFLGQLHLYGQRAMRDPKSALQYLDEAAKVPATAVEAHYFLGRLYQYGYLDEVDPALAQAQLLEAARQGYIPADGALARLYASAKGICANRVYAYVFAQLGARGGTDAILTLRDQLRAALRPEDLASATHLLNRELSVRSPAERAHGLAQADTSGGHP